MRGDGIQPRPIRLALVGCGYWGPKVLRAAASLPEIEVAALVDFDRSLAQAVQRHFPAARIASSQAGLVGDEIDAVIVATPAASHVDVAGTALESGAHVLVEKPLALRAADCRMLGEIARSRGLVLMAGHTFRFSPAVRCVRDLLNRDELGDVYYIDSQRLNLGRVRSDVDAIWNFAPHDISIIQEWMGTRPIAVHCHAYEYLQPGIPDLAFLVLEYGSAVAHVQVSWLSPRKVRRMTVVGSRKMVVYDDAASEPIVIHDAGIDRENIDRSFGEFESFADFKLIQRSGDLHVPRVPNTEPLVAQCAHFADCIRTGAKPITHAEDAAAIVEILEAATESHRRGGERVELELQHV